MLATFELGKDDIREALQLLCARRGVGELVAFEVVPAAPADPPYATPGEPAIRARVDTAGTTPVLGPVLSVHEVGDLEEVTAVGVLLVGDVDQVRAAAGLIYQRVQLIPVRS